MHPLLESIVRKKLRDGFADLGIALEPADHGLRALITLGDYVSAAQLTAVEWKMVRCEDLVGEKCKLPRAREAPVLALLSTEVFDDDANVEASFQVLNPAASLCHRRLPPKFLELRRSALNSTVAIIEENKTRPLGDSYMQRKFRYLREVLRSRNFLDERSRACLETARAEREGTGIRWPNTWSKPQINKRVETPLGRYNARVVDEQAAEKAARLSIKESRFPSVANGSAPPAFFTKKVHANYRRHSRFYPCSVAASKIPGEVEVLNILQSLAANLDDPVDAVIAAGLATFASPRSLSQTFALHAVGQIYVAEREHYRLHRPPSISGFYEPVTTALALPVPAAIANGLQKIQRLPEDLGTRITARLNSMAHRATYSKLMTALVCQGADWFGLPPELVALASRNRDRRPPAPAHYTRIGINQLRRALPYWKIFDPEFDFPPEYDSLAFGSNFKVTRCAAIDLFGTLPVLLEGWEALPDIDLINRINGVAALADWFVQLFTGKRAMESLPPTVHVFNPCGRTSIIRQKRETVIYYPTPLVAVLRPIREFFLRAMRTLRDRGVAGAPQQEIFFIYCFLKIAGRGGQLNLNVINPNQKNLALATARCPELRDYSGLLPSWTRHYSYSVLKDRGFHHAAVNAYHSHSAQPFDGVIWNSADPAVDPIAREAMAHCLAREIGLRDLL